MENENESPDECEVDGVKYVAAPEKRKCKGCAAESDFYGPLCLALAPCADRKIVWVQKEDKS